MDYPEFRRDYEAKHQASIPTKRKEVSPYPWWTQWGVFLMFLSAALLSGVHTIPVTYAGIPGGSLVSENARVMAANASFVAVELAILFSAFVMLVKSSMRFAYAVIAVCFFIAMVANVTSISQTLQRGETLDLGGVIISIAFGIGMPLIALMAGKLFVNIHSMERRLDKEAEDRLQLDKKAFDAEILTAWTSYERLSKRASKRASNEVSSGQSEPVSNKPSKVLDATAKVLQWLDDHPEDWTLSPRTLADKLGVGKSTVNNIQRSHRIDHDYTNGRGSHAPLDD